MSVIGPDVPLALTMGEPAGIAAEITLKAWKRLRETGPAFFYVGPSALLLDAARRMSPDVPVKAVSSASEASIAFRAALPVLDIALAHDVEIGRPSPETAGAVIASIERAVALAKEGQVAAVATNPIQKAVLRHAGFTYPGHTEFLQHLAGRGFRSTMMLVGKDLRVVPVTVHQSLRQAIAGLNSDMIVATALAVIEGLRGDFGIPSPRLAVAGLNPHAGESGTMGDEELRLIGPAVESLRSMGHDVSGPLPPDTMFTARARTKYDAAICMYHDQALIPLKTLDVDGGVNVTLGLSFVRTSPDHGTALDIAGRGIADPGSLIAALKLAADLGRGRKRGISA